LKVKQKEIEKIEKKWKNKQAEMEISRKKGLEVKILEDEVQTLEKKFQEKHEEYQDIYEEDILGQTDRLRKEKVELERKLEKQNQKESVLDKLELEKQRLNEQIAETQKQRKDRIFVLDEQIQRARELDRLMTEQRNMAEKLKEKESQRAEEIALLKICLKELQALLQKEDEKSTDQIRGRLQSRGRMPLKDEMEGYPTYGDHVHLERDSLELDLEPELEPNVKKNSKNIIQKVRKRFKKYDPKAFLMKRSNDQIQVKMKYATFINPFPESRKAPQPPLGSKELISLCTIFYVIIRILSNSTRQSFPKYFKFLEVASNFLC